MSAFAVVGVGSLGIAVGLGLAGVLDHVEWRLAERGRRRRSVRRRGFVGRSVR